MERLAPPAIADQRAQLQLRIAWLRHTGRETFALDPSGQLSAQLWDFADLLEVLDEGRAPQPWGEQ